MTKVTPTAVNYAEALYELNIPLSAVQQAEEIFSGSAALQKALENPVVSQREKDALIPRVFPKESVNLLRVLCLHDYSRLLPQVRQAYEDLIRQKNKVLRATLTCVTPPDAATQSRLKDFIRKKHHANEVELDIVQDASLVGGFILSCGGSVYDWSLSGRIQRMKQTLTRR